MIRTKEYYLSYTTEEVFSKLVEYDTIAEFLEAIKNNYNDKIAIVSNDHQYSYNDLYNDCLGICGFLKENNIMPGTNVGILLKNEYDFVRTVLGIMAYGAVPVLLPPQLDEKSIYGCSLKYNTALLIYNNDFEEKIAFAKTTNKMTVFVNVNNIAKTYLGTFNTELTYLTPGCIIMTGGTTGKSKGAVLSHGALLRGTLNGTYGFIDGGYNQVYYSMMPLTHVFGLIRNLLTSLYTGSVLYFCDNYKLIFKDLPVIKPTILVIVPALAEMILNVSKQIGTQVLGGRLKTIICGGAPVPPYLVQEYYKIGIALYPGYGLTESANIVSGNAEALNKPSSVGTLMPGQEFRIVDGELWIKGRNVLLEYYNEPEENQNAFKDGWFKTGDLVRFDEEGFLYIVGRIKDIIVLSNGENISPSELESKINELPFIQDSLVFEDKSIIGTQIIAVELFLRDSVIKAMSLDNVEEYVNNQINELNKEMLEYQRINKVIIRQTDFQRSPSMKIIRPKKVMFDA